MVQLEELIASFRACTGPFQWREFERMLRLLGYARLPPGKTGGSRRKFVHETTKHMIFVHEPHNGELGRGTVRDLRKQLEDGEVI